MAEHCEENARFHEEEIIVKKPANADISNLFRNFGGDTGSYKEIQQEYVDEKAQQSWPIVAAMEKERASTPVLKALAPRQSSSLGSKTGSFAAQLAPENHGSRFPVGTTTGVAPPSVVQGVPVAARESVGAKTDALISIFAKPEPVVQERPVSSLFAMPKAVPEPVSEPMVQSSPVSSLFASPAPKVAPVVQAVANSPFAALAAASKPASVGVSAKADSSPAVTQPVQQTRSENDPLNSVFSRLLNPPGQIAASAPNNNLRGLFGFLNK